MELELLHLNLDRAWVSAPTNRVQQSNAQWLLRPTHRKRLASRYLARQDVCSGTAVRKPKLITWRDQMERPTWRESEASSQYPASPTRHVSEWSFKWFQLPALEPPDAKWNRKKLSSLYYVYLVHRTSHQEDQRSTTWNQETSLERLPSHQNLI